MCVFLLRDEREKERLCVSKCMCRSVCVSVCVGVCVCVCVCIEVACVYSERKLIGRPLVQSVDEIIFPPLHVCGHLQVHSKLSHAQSSLDNDKREKKCVCCSLYSVDIFVPSFLEKCI